MKILGLLGTPRKGGNSELLLDAFLAGAAQAGADVERIALRELKISPCLEIYHCFKDGTCPIKDDMRPLYDKLLAADVVALASPIFFYSVSAQAKAMIDRCQALWARRYELKQDFPGPDRQGVLLAVGATHGKLLFVGARLVAKYFFDAINVTFYYEEGSLVVDKIVLVSGPKKEETKGDEIGAIKPPATQKKKKQNKDDFVPPTLEDEKNYEDDPAFYKW